MAESVHEQIAVALQAALATIGEDGGATYWYTPGAVQRISFFEDRLLDRSTDYLLLVMPGAETHREYSTGQCQAQMEVFVLVAKQFDGATEQPALESDPTRWQIVNRCVRDVLKKLWADVTLGGLAQNIAEDSLLVTRDRSAAGWCLAEISFSLIYTYPKATP